MKWQSFYLLLFATGLLFLLFGCGKINLVPELFRMPDEVRPFYNEYFDIVDPGKQVLGEIQFGAIPALNPDSHSICLQGGAYYHISLDESYWNSSTDNQKRSLVFHVLTHCTFLNYTHSSDENNYMYYNQTEGFSFDQLVPQVKSFTLSLNISVHSN